MSVAELKHDFPFDPTYGYTLETLLAIEPPEPPSDLQSFWQGTYAQTLATPLKMSEEECPSLQPGFRVRLIRFNGFQNARLGGWLVEPIDADVRRWAVVGHGYYNRPIEDIGYEPGAANFFFSCRGLGLSRQPEISDVTAFHVLHGIESRETFIHRGCVADVWAAASVMLELFPQAADRLENRGGSFGGGIGAMAAAWDQRLKFSVLTVPSFGNYPLRLQLPCNGSGEALRLKWLRHPEIAQTLRYFDSAVCAQFIQSPAFVGCALFDPAVQPPGQFSVYNAIRSRKELAVFNTGHFDTPETEPQSRAATAAAERMRDAVLGSR